MGAVTVQQMADRVAALMQERLNIGGSGLAAKLKRGGRRLPANVRREAEYLAELSHLAQHPKVQMMLDEERAAAAYDTCIKHLKGVGATDRMIGRALGIGGSIAFALLVVAGLFVAVLVWRRLI